MCSNGYDAGSMCGFDGFFSVCKRFHVEMVVKDKSHYYKILGTCNN